jgi:hypothetical protein
MDPLARTKISATPGFSSFKKLLEESDAKKIDVQTYEIHDTGIENRVNASDPLGDKTQQGPINSKAGGRIITDQLLAAMMKGTGGTGAQQTQSGSALGKSPLFTGGIGSASLAVGAAIGGAMGGIGGLAGIAFAGAAAGVMGGMATGVLHSKILIVDGAISTKHVPTEAELREKAGAEIGDMADHLNVPQVTLIEEEEEFIFIDGLRLEKNSRE